MITWVAVWVLTVPYRETARTYTYQLTYSSQEICLKQAKKHNAGLNKPRCDFQQIPVVMK